MIVFTLLLIASSALAASVRDQKMFYDLENAEQHFEEFINTYGRQYADEKEKQMRFEIFKESLASINEMNLMHEYAVFGITRFVDLTTEELACFSGTNIDTVNVNATVIGPDYKPVWAPEEFDWRERNVVTGVKNQLTCGSCWAFGDIGSLEGQYAIKTGQLQEFSEQQLVDCDTQSQGCMSGNILSGLQSIIDKGGVMSEQDYPYQGVQGQCSFDANKAAARVASVREIQADEEQLKGILYENGPIAIVVDSTGLHKYQGGVLKNCYAQSQDRTPLHAMLLVGYGVDQATQTPYWLIKNSWGTSYGEQGYLRLARGSQLCGITRYSMGMPTIP